MRITLKKKLITKIKYVFILAFLNLNQNSYALKDYSLAYSSDNNVTISLTQYGQKKFVTGVIIIDKSPKEIWPILTNPYEYKEQINQHLKKVEVELDNFNKSILKCDLEYCFILPKITYVVESYYEPYSKISFKSISGTLKDFEGIWELESIKGTKFSKVSFAMYIDPGIPVPAFIVRQGIRFELPNTLLSLKHRIHQIYDEHAKYSQKNIKASLIANIPDHLVDVCAVKLK